MSGSFTSRETYAVPLTQPGTRGPDARGASQVSDTLAQGLAQVSGQFMQLWAAADQARTVNDASSAVAKLSMDIADMQRGFDADPDPATVPQRFRQRAAEFRAAAIEGLDPAVAGLVGRQLDTQLIPTAYRQVTSAASQRHIGNLRGQFADTLGTQAQQIAAARDEPQLLQHVQAIKAGIAGNVAAGLYTQADATPLFSRAIAQAVTIRSATDPAGAQALLERYKAEMDAGTVATLTTSLRAPVERSRAEGAATATMAGRGTAGSIHDAILMQESGGRDGQVSVDGARGRMQIMPGTWAQYARPGENIDNPADNQAVGRRIIDDLSAKAGGDPARIAVGYFSGPGNIAPPGSPTPWKEDRRDGNGMSVSRYVAQVLNRMTPPAAERSDSQKAALLDDVRDRLKDEPLHVQLQGQALVAQMLNHEQAGQEQARAVLGRELSDLSAAYQAGNTAPAIPENRIRQLLPPEQAQRTIDSLTINRTVGDAVKAAAYASPEDQAALGRQIAGDPSDVRLAAERQEGVALYRRGWQRIQEALKDDPGGYAATAPEVQQLVQAGATPPQIMAASIAVQQRMGVLPSARRLLTNDQATRMAELLRSTGPEKADMGVTLAKMAADFGAGDPDPSRRATGAALFNAALGELVKHQKIDWGWIAFAGMDRPEQAQGRANLQAWLKLSAERGGAEGIRKLLPPDHAKNLPTALETQLVDLRVVTRNHPGGMAMFDNTRRAMEAVAQMRIYSGETASEAAKNAYNDVIGHKWEPAGDDGSGWMFDTHTLLVPKGQGGAIETSLATVRGAIQPADIMPLPDPMRRTASEAELRDATASAARRGFWINNADGSGAVLVGRSTGGAIINIMRADGRPIEVRFEHLPTAAQRSAGATVTPAGQMVPPRTPQPFNPDFSSWSQRQGAAPPAPTTFLEAMSRPSFDPYTAASNWLADTALPVAGRLLERTSPGVQMLQSVGDIRLPSWSQRARDRYSRPRPGTPMEGDR
jgi:soluble lytic murein transglycosylase-like protein